MCRCITGVSVHLSRSVEQHAETLLSIVGGQEWMSVSLEDGGLYGQVEQVVYNRSLVIT